MTENCLIEDTLYRGKPVRGVIGGYFIEGIDSAEKCQEECAKDPDCNYFTWNSPRFWNEIQRNKCWLKAGKGKTRAGCGKACTGRISGPKSCKYSLLMFIMLMIK